MKRRRFYEKSSEKATRERGEAIRRANKLARKKAQREGLIAARKGKKVPRRRPTGWPHSRAPADLHACRDAELDALIVIRAMDVAMRNVTPNALQDVFRT